MEEDLKLRSPYDESHLCGRNAVYAGGLCGRPAVESKDIRMPGAADENTFYNVGTTRVDEANLNTLVEGDGVLTPFYRADTTLVFADNDIMDCSYHK